MANKVTVDLGDKLIIVNNAVTGVDTEIDLYSDLKEDWIENANGEIGFEFPFRTIGGDPLPGGLEAGAFFFLRNDLGWRIRPYEGDHELIITGNLFPEDSAHPMTVPTTGGYTVSIAWERSSLTQQAQPSQIADAVWDESTAGYIIIDAIKAKTDTLPAGIKKNQPYNNFGFFMIKSSDHVTGATGLSITTQRSIDGGSFMSCNNGINEIGNGAYNIDLDADDLNGDVIILYLTAPNADPRAITILTAS